MIPQIKEINFPAYATLSQATVTLNDMGEKTISAQVKIDGSIAPDFSFDWEVEFQGERYIQPLREPQASKGNESLSSVIDLTFQHWTIYQLKRYYFVQTAPLEGGTAVADKYIASLGLNLDDFITEFDSVLGLYFKKGEVKIKLNPKWEYDKEPSYMEISYTHIWDVLLKLYEVYGVRWSIEGNTIMVGYDTEEVSHTFEYGFEGGLLKVERQVQSDQLANSLLGRGGDKNLPYRYFKDVDEQNPTFLADPDWIPELKNISFTNLRGKTFRDYVKGWKAHRYGGEPMAEPTEEYLRGYADSEKSTDTESFFNPIEYVEDKESIDKYGLLQNGLDNVEDVFPTIQGVEVEGLGRVDEAVYVEKVEYDALDYAPETTHSWSDTSTLKTFTITQKGTQTFKIVSEPFSIGVGMVGALYAYLANATMVANGNAKFYDYVGGTPYNTVLSTKSNIPIECEVVSIHFFDANSKKELTRLDYLTSEVKIYYEAEIKNTNAAFRFENGTYTSEEVFTGIDPDTGWPFSTIVSVPHDTWWEMEPEFELTIDVRTPLYQIQFGGEIIDNNVDNKPISSAIEIAPKADGKVVIQASDISVKGGPATMIDIPISTTAYEKNNATNDLKGQIEYKRNIIISNKETGESVNIINIPEGEYYCRVEVECHNNSSVPAIFSVSLMPTYLFPPAGRSKWTPTFDIWIKNIWGTTREQGESEEAYVDRVWTPILGNRGEEAKVCFSTGNLAGHSDYEFPIYEVHYDNSESLGGVNSEWRLTLAKSDAEVEATGMYIPNSTTGGQAFAGDKFFFIGIDMPHQYILWAEERLDQYKREQLKDTAHIKPTWVVQTDKVRLNEVRDDKKLLDSFKVGNIVHLFDKRFTPGQESLYIQSITYTWDSQTVIFPNVEVVLSDKIAVSSNPVAKLQGEVDVLTKQVGSMSNIQQVVRAVGDRLYLRKDGVTEEVSTSRTKFANIVSSKDYQQGAVGGKGWGLRSEQGKGVIEADKLIVRDEMQVNSLVVNQVSAIGGKEILSAASMICSKVEVLVDGFKCYFDQKQGSVANQFVVHDIAYSQVYNPHSVSIKSYKREVIEVGDNYIMLSNESNGDGAPQVGDIIVQYGNTDTENNANRQYVIIRDVIGGGYERMISHLDDIYSSGSEYYFAGRMNGGNPRWFVGDTLQYVKFEDGKISLECKQVGMTSEGSSDDTVRIWAGADNDKKDNAPFRVQQNGKVIATDGEFKGTVNMDNGYLGGFIRKKVTHINDNTISEYVKPNIEGHYVFDMNKVGSIIYLEEPLESDFSLTMPTYYKGQAYDMPQGMTVDDLRGMLGNYLLVYNFSDNYGSFCGKRYYRNTGEMQLGYVCYTDWLIKPNEMFKLACTTAMDKDGEEVIYWEITKVIGKKQSGDDLEISPF